MVSVVVAPPRGDPCGEVPGADFGELPRLPQSYHEHNRHGFEAYGVAMKYPARRINFPACSFRYIHTVEL